MPLPDASDQKKIIGDAAEVTETCIEIEGELAALRAKYEQFFLGLERKPPTEVHQAVKKKIAGLRNTFVRQVSAKFRIDAINSKFSTYERLWARTIQEIEAGTYKRDLFKAKLHQKEREEKARAERKEARAEEKVAAEQKAAADQKAAAEQKAAAAAPGRVAPPAPSKGPVAPVAVQGQLSDQKMKAIYDAYVMAKKRCNEDTSKLSLDALSATLRKQVPELMKTHNAKSVEFKVVIKDGKAILRALPKET